MSYLGYKVWHFPAGETGSYDITGAVDLSNDDGLNSNAGTYDILLKNDNAELADSIKYGDKIKLMAGFDGSLNILEYGKVEEEQYDFNNNRSTKTVKGYGSSKELQNFLVNQIIKSGTTTAYIAGSENYTYDNINSRNIVKVILAQHVNSDSTLGINYSTYVDAGSLCRPWAETVGSNFFKVWVNTKACDAIEQIRLDKYTGAGDYDFYIDAGSCLHFEPKGLRAADIVLTEGSNILGYSMKRSIKPKFTAINVFCGRDENNLGIYAAGYNSAGISQYGYKWGYSNHGYLWNNVSGAHAGESLADIKSITKETGRAVAKSIAETQGLPKWEGTVNLRGTTQFTLASGQYVNVNFPSVTARLSPGSMILTDVKHVINNRGWFTTLALEEKQGDIF